MSGNRIVHLFRGAYGGLSATIWWLAIVQLINRSGTMVVFFLAVYLRDEVGLDLDRVGVAMACFGAGTLVGVFIGGRLIDRIGYYRVMLWSLCLGGLLFLGVSLVRSFPLMCAGLFALSACGEAFRPANMTAVSVHSTPETYTRSIAINRLAINLGFSVGPAVGGFLASVDYHWIFWTDGLTCLAAAMIVFVLIRPRPGDMPQSPDESPSSWESPYRDRLFLAFLPIAASYAIGFFQFFSTMPLYYKEHEHLTEVQIGWLMAINGFLVAAFEMILVFILEKKGSLFRPIIAGALLLMLSYLLLLVWGGWWWMLLITVLISFSEMLAMPFMNTFMNMRASRGSKGQYASLYIMAWSSSQIFTPLLATQVIRTGGYSLLWMVLAGLLLFTTIGARLLSLRVARPSH